MKKRVILVNSIILFFALSSFLIINIFVLRYHNNQASKKELKQELALITQLYDGDNQEEIINLFKDKNIRITIITYEGEVLYDSSSNTEFDSHLDRPEILNLGEVYSRYSKSLDVNMMYVANKVSGVYLRIAMPQKSIDVIVNNFLVFGFLALLSITIISIFLLNSVNKKALIPLNNVVNKLSLLAGQDNYYGDDIETISSHIDKIKNSIDEKIIAITNEKSKVDFIINNLEQGVIVINSDGKLILVNKFILELRNIKEPEIINKDYIYLIRNLNFQKSIEQTINDGTKLTFDLNENAKTYVVNISPINWVGINDEKNYVFITLNDVSDERDVERMKREFFDNSSHELKSPLTTIVGYQQLITEGIISSKKEILDACERTIKEASRMHKIILEMLELSKLENKENAYVEKLNIKNVVLDNVSKYNKEILDKNIEVDLALDDLCLLMNNSHLNQLVRNLIENAIKYNTNDGKLEIIVNNKTREFIVKDNGIGISLEDQPRVFERFYRVDKARSKDQSGTGLGLSIVKHICNLYHANITLTSKLNQGTTVKIKLRD